ncbi:hypothetical protein P691DRAFT_785653 [Macrolepiota fuliginosa MF-IS2]|uniref:Uncharacterized protein n=1 Tax=Macrolepiota fuliginosa MF-IS2 TaxID=1400762 RepID=A0A9P6BVR3_9AGAR|nr:hypothetical protein P691DRAFT_785653 [Macrolepiota fuliginosa MF-IS2]
MPLVKDKIKKYTFIVMIDPALPGYIKDCVPTGPVFSIIQKYPGWGYTATMAHDATKKALVNKIICDTLTDVHSNFKLFISKSIIMTPSEPCDIHSLCSMETGDSNHLFWHKVDDNLKAVRKNKNDDCQRISEVFSNALNTDIQKYLLSQEDTMDLPDVSFMVDDHVEDFEILAGWFGLQHHSR